MVTLYKVEIERPHGKEMIQCYPVDGLCVHMDPKEKNWLITHMRSGKIFGESKINKKLAFPTYNDAVWAARILTRQWNWDAKEMPCTPDELLVAIHRKVLAETPERAICLRRA